MEIVLLERIEKLGQMGDVVKVRDGYARNFLLPQKKAMRATKENMISFNERRATIEARNLVLKQEAESVAVKVDGRQIVVIRQAGDSGHLYGSVNSRDITESLIADGFNIGRQQVQLQAPIKNLGEHSVKISLHPDVAVFITVTVARSLSEASQLHHDAVVVAGVEAEELEA